MNKNRHRVALQIEGPRITSEKFARGVSAFVGIVNDIAGQVSKKKDAITWVISVEQGSAMIVAEPQANDAADVDMIPPVLKAIGAGASSLEISSEVPPYFSERALEKMRDLASITDGKDQGISFVKIIIDHEPVRVSSQTTAHVDDILGVKATALGSIEGRLEMLTRRGGYKCAVYDDLSDRRVECFFSPEMKEQVKSAWDTRVSVYGIISYRKTGEPVSIKVQDFRQLSASDLPSFDDMKGILKD